MVIIERKQIDSIPVLEVVQQEVMNQPLPTVFFLHGFTSVKEKNLHYAYLLAEKNIRVVLPEAKFHGERSDQLTMEQLSLQFWNIILTSIAELDILKEVYLKNNRSIANKIGVAGTSMGGITTLGALTQHKWITAGVSLMGNPNYNQFARFLVTQIEKQGLILPFTTKQLENEYKKVQAFDLSLHADKLQGRPLLFWHGKKDPVVPYSYAYNFYQEVKNQYKDHPEDLQFILDEHAEHKVTREGVLKTVEWFEKHLT